MSERRALLVLFTLAILAGAALLFVVEPMAAKLLLPRLGGAPAVWNGCLLFFQTALLAGYLYAHVLGRLPARAQVVVHGVVLVAALAVLPPALPKALLDPAGHAPLVWLVAALGVAVGLPFVALAATGPLVQRWFSRTDHPLARDPYFLYVASNVGSLGGLLLYPFVVEPALPLTTPGAALFPPRLLPWSQGTLWTAAFASAAALVAACGIAMLRRPAASPPAISDEAAPTLRQRATWVALAAIPSSLVLGATQYITADVAVVPLLWVVPLAAYLVSLALAFGRRPLGSERAWGWALAVVAVGVTLGYWALARPYAWALLVLHPLAVLVAGTVCHRRLAALRPAPARLTEFYLCVALGGALGGAFNAIVAPAIFPAIVEYPIALIAACLVRPRIASARERRALVIDLAAPAALAAAAVGLQAWIGASGWTSDAAILLVVAVVPCAAALALGGRPLRFALALAALMTIAARQSAIPGTLLHRERTFFGVHRVLDQAGPTFRTQDASGHERLFQRPYHVLMHGTTTHGEQVDDDAGRTIPSTYYHPTGPLGQLFAAFPPDARLAPVAVIGAGAGTIAAYARPERPVTFYEIDPAVVRIARDRSLFTYVAEAKGPVTFVTGDGRLEIGKAADGAYGLIVVDAFNSDAIPVHLLTREALALYLRKLRPGGLIALHLTNQNLDLVPVVTALAADARIAGIVEDDEVDSADELMQRKKESQWAVLAADRATLAPLMADPRWKPLAPAGIRRALWTDDYSSLFSVVENW